ncbi:MAG TPA: GNAT family N-acetyltransferase [Prosthecobacter sp.]|nr:GNAT family N-acetyltransferase [Prosthecobacter sp.]
MASARLRLVPLQPGHAELLLGPLGAPELYAFIPGSPPADLDALRARFNRVCARRSPDGDTVWMNWVAFDRAGQAVGLFEATARAGLVHVAYFVFVAHQRQGFAREALQTIMGRLAACAAVQGICADVDTRNTASVRLLRGLGFPPPALVPHADEFKGAVSDEYVFRLTLARAA